MVVVLLMAVGTAFVYSASANISQELKLERFYDFQSLRQILFFPLAVIVMYTACSFDYRRLSLANGWLRSPTTYLLVISIGLLMLVLSQRFHPFLPGLIPRVNQHYRWMRIPFGPVAISFQPSELAKWSVIFFLAGFCTKYSESLKLFWKRFVPVSVVIGLVVGLIIIEDFGTAAFIALLSLLLLIIGGVRLWHILPPLPLAAIAFTLAIIVSPGRMNRIIAFLQPDKFTDGINYQPSQSRIALGSGGLWGKGLGRGICKYGHLPEDTTDFIFAIIGEELGFVGTMAVIGLFIIFVWLGILVVGRCHEADPR